QLCFAYPSHLSGRLHGPRGYAQVEAYRHWLRDEFSYRCAYCLMRETWLRGKSGFQIDHCIPRAQDRGHLLDYDNLVYTCPWCNQAKSGVSSKRAGPRQKGTEQEFRAALTRWGQV